MPQPSPFGDDLLWDTLYLGGEAWPGIPQIETEKSRDIDIAKQKGQDGATLTDQGYPGATVKITIRVWLDSQWAELNRLLPTIDPRVRGAFRTPIDIIHPEPNLKGVKQIYVKKIGATTVDKGVVTQVIECAEWFPETKPAKSKSKTSKTDTTGGAIPTGKQVVPPSANKSAQKNLI